MGTTLMIEGRASYLQQLWEEGQFDGAGDFYWSATCLMDPAKPKQAKAIAEIEAAERVEFKKAYMASKGATEANFEKAFNARANDERALRDGDLKGGEYEGMMYVAARATKGKQAKPVVLDLQAARVEAGMPGAPYAGCKIVMQIEVWAQYSGKYKRTNCTLLGVQFAGDGDAFGGGKPADLSKFQSLANQGQDDEGDEEALAGLT